MTDPTNAVRNRARNAAEKGVQAGLTYVGVPPAVSKKIAPIVLKFGGPALALLMLLQIMAPVTIISTIFGGGDDWNVNTATAAQYVNEPFLEAYVAAGEEYQIPWTLLAAVGARASFHGRINPYEGDVPSYLLVPPPSSAAPTSVLYIGDSLGVGSQPSLNAALDGTVVADVEQGRFMTGGISVLRKAVRDEDGLTLLTGQAVVIDLGTNDTVGNPALRSVAASRIDTMLSLVDLSTRVFWVNVAHPDAVEFNKVLEESRSQHPNLVVVDWAGHATSQSIQPGEDGIHYNAESYTLRGQFIADTITSGVSAVSGNSVGGKGSMEIPAGDCPSTQRPIVGSRPGQPVGPLLLLPDQMERFDISLGNPHNICASATALAERFSQVRDELVEERDLDLNALVEAARDGSPDAAQVVQRFWAEVVDRSGVLGSAKTVACEAPPRNNLNDQEWVAATIEDIWDCETAGTGLSLVSKATNLGGVWTYERVDQANSPRLYIQEALAVAWSFSQWGAADCDRSDSASDIPQGVFPLTLAIFDAYTERDENRRFVGNRCDPMANIRAAARAFAAREALDPAARATAINTTPAPYRPVWGGWEAMPLAAGPETVRLDFGQNGPWVNPATVESCVATANDFIRNSVTDEMNPLNARTLREVTAVTSEEGDSKLVTQLDTYLDAAATRISQTCSSAPLPVSAGWSVLRQVSSGEGLVTFGFRPSPVAASLDDVAQPGDVLAAVTAQIRTSTITSASTTPTADVTALVQRLSPTPLTVELPFLAPRNRSTLTGADVVSTAYLYGGLFEGGDINTVEGFGLIGATVPFADVFNFVGQKFQIDPRLLAAIAFQESNFNIAARCDDLDYTGTDGYGMMQKDLGLDRREERVLMCQDVETNPDVAATYQVEQAATLFQAFLNEVDGDVEGALLAYNSGGYLGRFWAQVRPEVEALRNEARRYWCEQRPLGWANQARAGVRGCEWRGDVTAKYVNPTPGTRSAVNKYREYQMLFPAMVLSAAQNLIGPDGCPTQAPPSAIPGLATARGVTVDFYDLCVRSVAQAPTPEAAAAIKWVMARAGTPYSQSLRSRDGYFDCSSLVMRGYAAAGLPVLANGLTGEAPTTHTLLPWGWGQRPSWSVPVPLFEARPGDLYFTKYGTDGDGGGHVAMLLADGYLIHAPATGDIVHVRARYVSDGVEPLVRRIDPSLARLSTGA